LKDFRIYEGDQLPFFYLAVPICIKSLDISGYLAAHEDIYNGIEITRRGDFCLRGASFNRNRLVGNRVL